MAQLLSQAAARGMMPDYLGKLLAAFEAEKQETENKSDRPSAQPLVEPLSQRAGSPAAHRPGTLQRRDWQTAIPRPRYRHNNRRIFDKLQVQRRTSLPPAPAGFVVTYTAKYSPHSLFSVKQNNTSINTKVSTQPPVLRIYCLSLSNRRILMDIYEAIYTTLRHAAAEARPHPLRCAGSHPGCCHSRTPHRRRMAIHPGRRPGHQVAARAASTGKDLSA